MKPAKIQAAFAAALLDTFQPITDQPTDEDMTRLKSIILQQVVPIPYDGELGKHNLMGLVLPDANYKARHNGKSFPAYQNRPGAYTRLASAAIVGERVEKEATHKVEDWKIFDCAQRKVRAFIIASVEDTWICEHHNPITVYIYVAPRTLLNRLWGSCTGLHSLDVLAIRDSLRTMYKDT